jgi:hypothetical protein
VIIILRASFTTKKHGLTLITILLGLSMPLLGCSSLTTGLSNQSTSSTSAPNLIDTTTTTDKTIPSVADTPSDTNSDTQTTSQSVSQPTKTTPTKATEKKNPISLSKAKYNQLEYGYTYEKVKSLLGDTGEVVTESGVKGSKSYTVTYLYHIKSPSNAEVFLAFKDDKLVNKMEVNLQ